MAGYRHKAVHLNEKSNIFEETRVRPMNSRILADFSKQVYVMLQSGIPLVQAMNILVQKDRDVKTARVCRDVYRRLLQGYSMSEAMGMQNGVFPPMMVSMVKAGESGGQLAKTMSELTEYYEKEYVMRKKIESALVYPLFLMAVVTAVMVLLFTVVLPEIFSMFESFESLPSVTRFLVWISGGLVSRGGLVILICIGTAAALIYLSGLKAIRYMAGRLAVHLPGVGSMARSVYTARFARTLSTLYENGVPVVHALGLAADVVGNRYIVKQLKEVLPDICEGVPLSAGISKVDGLDERLALNIYIGEESGELADLLGSVAARFDVDAREAAEKMTTLIEPVLIVVMGLIIGVIMLSVMLPLMQYYQNIG